MNNTAFQTHMKGEINSLGQGTGGHLHSAIRSGQIRQKPLSAIKEVDFGGEKIQRFEIEVYDGRNYVSKVEESTFFPSTWSDKRTLEEIALASTAIRPQGLIEYGLASNGMRIRFIRNNGTITSAFPLLPDSEFRVIP